MFNEFRFAPVLVIALAACSTPSEVVEAPLLLVEPAADVETITPHSPKVSGRVRAGVLTAGDIDDGQNLPAFQYMAAKASTSLDLPNPGGGQSLLVTLTGPNGAPAPGVRVALRRPGAETAFYDGYTGVGGRLMVFPHVLGQGRLGEVELRAFGNGASLVQTVRPGRANVIALPYTAEWAPDFLDLAFAVDTTGSMEDELAWLERDLIRVVDQARKIRTGLRIRYGLVTYKDQGDEYVARNYGFTDNARTMRDWLRGERASGGGDYPEASALALKTAVGLDWRRGKGERLLFHIADAPPHRRDAKTYLNAASNAARNQVQVFGLGASGVADEAEYLMRQASLVTGGRYLFLTDDSGVGFAHAEPRVSCYRVTSLSGLMRRVLMSELSGKRFEATQQNIIREVGTYRAGRCLN
ncbi:MAG: vWA domain-containing protein [Pseudomonadota bacterium]